MLYHVMKEKEILSVRYSEVFLCSRFYQHNPEGYPDAVMLMLSRTIACVENEIIINVPHKIGCDQNLHANFTCWRAFGQKPKDDSLGD